jgi:uncharacterized membrane protein YkgB
MRLDDADTCIVGWMRRNGMAILQWTVSLMFIWFGFLKVIGHAPATETLVRTLYWGVDAGWFVPFFGWWEIIIGVTLLWRKIMRAGILLLLLQFIGTLLPLLIMPRLLFQDFNPFLPTEIGIELLRSIVLIAVALVIGGTARDQKAEALMPHM